MTKRALWGVEGSLVCVGILGWMRLEKGELCLFQAVSSLLMT